MTREELEKRKYPLVMIKFLIAEARTDIGKVECTHKLNIANTMIGFNRLINEELERGRFGSLE